MNLGSILTLSRMAPRRRVDAAQNTWPVRVLRPPVPVGYWTNFGEAMDWLKHIEKPTYPESPIMLVLDLNGIVPVPAILTHLLDTLVAQIRSKRFEMAGIVVSTQDPGVRQYVEMLGQLEDIPLYLSNSTTNFSIVQATPAAPMTSTEAQTLRAVMNAGGSTTAKQLSAQLEIGHTAAINRLNALVDRGLLVRQASPGRASDVYTDRRAAGIQHGEQNLAAALAFEQARAAG